MPSNAFIFPSNLGRSECSAAPQVKSWKPPAVTMEREEEQEKTRLSVLLSIELKRLLPPSEAQLACACVVLSMCEYVWLLAPRVSSVTPAVLLSYCRLGPPDEILYLGLSLITDQRMKKKWLKILFAFNFRRFLCDIRRLDSVWPLSCLFNGFARVTSASDLSKSRSN